MNQGDLLSTINKPSSDDGGSNVPEYSVSEISQSLKKTVEQSYSHVRVRGEISRVTLAKSGHLYTSLKDDNAVLDAICWRGTVSRLSVKAEEGLEVIVTGRLTTYPGRSNYQIIIEDMQLAGEGALLKMLEDRRKRLAAEGLFDEQRKKPVPYLPNRIGVITSPTGAVIRDILHRLQDRFPRHVLLYPVMVQGKGAAEQIAHAIEVMNRHEALKTDVLILARGGGSLEDLMPFNEEIVVRAVAASHIPIITAVGHETDTTLVDYASDLRAPTPTGAAEKVVPVRQEIYQELLNKQTRLTSAWQSLASARTDKVQNLHSRMGRPERLFEMKAQQFDHLENRLNGGFNTNLTAKEQGLNVISSRLAHPKQLLNLKAENLKSLSGRLTLTSDGITKPRLEKLSYAHKMLESLSFKSVIKRGYAVLRNKDGMIASTTETLDKEFSITLQDGVVDAEKK